MTEFAKYRKAIVAALGALIILANEVIAALGDTNETVAQWITVGVGIATAVGVYLVRNAALLDSVGSGQLPQFSADNPNPVDEAARRREQGQS